MRAGKTYIENNKMKLNLKQERNLETHRDYPVKKKAETRLVYPHAKECHNSPAGHWKLGEAWSRSFQPSKGTPPAGANWISDVCPPDLKDNKILLLKSLSSWHFVTVALQTKASICSGQSSSDALNQSLREADIKESFSLTIACSELPGRQRELPGSRWAVMGA